MPLKKVKSVEASDRQERFPPPPPQLPAKRPKGAEERDADLPKPLEARKAPARPSTIEMVKEALEALDSRKGSSARAIRGYILDKYPSVDAVRLKYMLRKALTKGLENGDLVRPANSSGNGAQGRFRIPAKSKAKAKAAENTDPNAGRALKAEKAAVKKPKVQEGAEKVKPTAKKQKIKTTEDTGSPKGAAAAKKPVTKKVATAASQTSAKVTGGTLRKGKGAPRPRARKSSGAPAPQNAREVVKVMA